MSFLKVERKQAIVRLTMSDPESRNALTGSSVADEFVQVCEELRHDDVVKAVILTAEGPVFSSGGNIRDMAHLLDDSFTPDALQDVYRRGIQRIPRALYNLDVPVICAVNGPAIGAGLDLTCMCDLRIASERATFAESFVRMGLVPGDGGAWLLPRVVGWAIAREMAFTGDTLTAQEALHCGLVSRVVPHEALLDEAMSLAERIAANSGAALRMTKRLLRESEKSSLESLLELSAAYQASAHKTTEHRQAVRSFMERRASKSG